MIDFLQAKNKPDDWPINEKEVLLENIYVSLNSFIENPGYRTKEVIVSLVSTYDLNQRSYIGTYRVSSLKHS